MNPASSFPTYFSAEVFAAQGFPPTTVVADLALPTLAAMAPSDFEVVLCDENVSPVDFDVATDFVGITGKITQSRRMVEIARRFRERGTVVIIGGPYASLCPEAVRPHCDILVRGEVEDIIGDVFADLRSGRWKDEYVGNRPDLAASPLPRWDLYPNDRAWHASVQTSRGCPFECEFCDAIQYLGRKQRHKPIAHVLAELDEVYRHGYRAVFLADDNFTAYRARAKELLVALRDWNRRQEAGHVSFLTQVSINAAKDEQLLEMCAQAGLTHMFIGIETANEDSLRETKKRQNLGIDIAERVQRFLDHGILVTAGMIVGFDADGSDVFERQYELAMSTPIPIFSVGALVAQAATPLHARMAKAGRLVAGESEAETAAMPWATNIIPRHFTREQLFDGLQQLCQRLYHPTAFGDRVLHFIDRIGARRDPRATDRAWRPKGARAVELQILGLLKNLARLGPAERAMWSRIRDALSAKPDATDFVFGSLMNYMQVRHMYNQGQFTEYHVGSLSQQAVS